MKPMPGLARRLWIRSGRRRMSGPSLVIAELRLTWFVDMLSQLKDLKGFKKLNCLRKLQSCSRVSRGIGRAAGYYYLHCHCLWRKLLSIWKLSQSSCNFASELQICYTCSSILPIQASTAGCHWYLPTSLSATLQLQKAIWLVEFF
jgi:hypothetical protein